MMKQDSDTASTEVLTVDLDENIKEDYVKGFTEQKSGRSMFGAKYVKLLTSKHLNS